MRCGIPWPSSAAGRRPRLADSTAQDRRIRGDRGGRPDFRGLNWGRPGPPGHFGSAGGVHPPQRAAGRQIGEPGFRRRGISPRRAAGAVGRYARFPEQKAQERRVPQWWMTLPWPPWRWAPHGWRCSIPWACKRRPWRIWSSRPWVSWRCCPPPPALAIILIPTPELTKTRPEPKGSGLLALYGEWPLQ